MKQKNTSTQSRINRSHPIADEDIDYSDIPPIKNFKNAIVRHPQKKKTICIEISEETARRINPVQESTIKKARSTPKRITTKKRKKEE
jgi:hypothetical protein